MVCKQCGRYVDDGERYCQFCGAPVARPAEGQRQPVRKQKAAGISIGGIRLSVPQFITGIASIIGLLAFMFYFFAPRTVTAGDTSSSIGFGDFFTGTGHTGFFFTVGAIFTFLAVVLVALPLVLQVICKNDEGGFEIHAVSFILYFFAFLTNIITASTLGKELSAASATAVVSTTFWHLLYILFSIVFLLYLVLSAFFAYRTSFSSSEKRPAAPASMRAAS